MERPDMHSIIAGVKGRFLRPELLDVLRSNLTNELHLDHQLLSYEELDNEITLHFDNGHTASCDFLVGADGIRSAVRAGFLENQGLSHSPSIGPIWTGAYVYRGLISVDQLRAEYPGHRACETGVYVRIRFHKLDEKKTQTIHCSILENTRLMTGVG
jgi:salicylate hydroxylase